MPRLERSAGFVIYRDAPDAPGGRVYLLLDYGRHWDYAKGHVEKGEDDLQAAIRELHEETGLPAPRVVEGFSHQIEYTFHSSRHGEICKQVILFIGLTKQTTVILSEEHVGSVYLSYESALDRLTYPAAKQVLQAARAFLDEKKP